MEKEIVPWHAVRKELMWRRITQAVAARKKRVWRNPDTEDGKMSEEGCLPDVYRKGGMEKQRLLMPAAAFAEARKQNRENS
jgi:hypothetical protein